MMKRSIWAILLAGLTGFFYWPIATLAASPDLIMISEVQITGQSAKDEFVEIYNAGEENFDLSACQLKKYTASGSAYLLHRFGAGATVMAKDFYVLGSAEWSGEAAERYSTSQSLANDNSLQLLCGETEIDLLGWGTVALFETQALETVNSSELWSYQRLTKIDTDNNFSDFKVGTPCARCAWPDEENENLLVIESAEDPLSEVVNETDNEVLNETTNSETQEDLPITSTEETSIESESISVPDLEASTETAPVLESVAEPVITEETTVLSTTSGDNVVNQNVFPKDSPLILLSELYPAPNSGENEYLEIYNAGETKIDLNNWFITDLSEKKFVLKNLFLEPGEYYLLYYAQSKITLNNDEDQINLYNSLGQWRQGVRYVKAPKGKALFLDDGGQWRWGETSPGFVNPEFVEVVINIPSPEISSSSSVINNNSASVVVADPAPVLVSISGEESKAVKESSSSAKASPAMASAKTSAKKSKEYQVSNLAAWATWQANDLLLIQAKVLLDSSWGVTNRCFLGQGNYALPILCTTLKDKFVSGENVAVKAKVYFKNNQFEYLKVEEVWPYVDEIELKFKTEKNDLDEYQLWQGSGIIDELNSSRRLGKLANANDVWTFRFPKGNALAVGDQMIWQAVQWKGENYFLLTEDSKKVEVLAPVVDSVSVLESAEASAQVIVDGKLFGAAFSGLGGSCYAVWRWRGVLLKILPKIFG